MAMVASCHTGQEDSTYLLCHRWTKFTHFERSWDCTLGQFTRSYCVVDNMFTHSVITNSTLPMSQQKWFTVSQLKTSTQSLCISWQNLLTVGQLTGFAIFGSPGQTWQTVSQSGSGQNVRCGSNSTSPWNLNLIYLS